MRNKSCLECVNSNCLITHLDKEKKEFFNQNKRVIEFRKGDIILRQGLLSETMSFIYSGKVRVYIEGNSTDKIQVVRLSKEGDSLGHRAIKHNILPISASALSNSLICFVEKSLFLELLKQSNAFQYHFLLFFAEELQQAELLARNHSMMSVKELIVDTILRLLAVYGKCPRRKTLNIILSRQDIAEIAGTTKQQVSKYLAELQEENLIKLMGKSIVIHSESELKALIHSYT
jgi:CRP/FNR family transcriptional regulator, anaerobic regulatory protein